MGRDKARVLVHGRSLLAQVRAIARDTGHPVRVIRRDLVERCGPLGGVYTGLATSKAAAVLFLACDMPFVSAALLKRVVAASDQGVRAAFSTAKERCGFPFVLPRGARAAVQTQLARKAFSLQALAAATKARRVPVSPATVFNINTPEDLETARRRLSDRG